MERPSRRTPAGADSRPDSPAQTYSFRLIVAFATADSFDLNLNAARRIMHDSILNVEAKVLVRARPEGMLSPLLITDRAVLLTYDDETSSYRWGVVLEGRQYVTLFARWFDDRWAAIPDRYMIFTRSGLNQTAVALVRENLERVAAAESVKR